MNRDCWAIRSSVCSFIGFTHSFTGSLICWLIHSLARSLTLSRTRGKVNDSMSQSDVVLSHSGPAILVHFWFLWPLNSIHLEHRKCRCRLLKSIIYSILWSSYLWEKNTLNRVQKKKIITCASFFGDKKQIVQWAMVHDGATMHRYHLLRRCQQWLRFSFSIKQVNSLRHLTSTLLSIPVAIKLWVFPLDVNWVKLTNNIHPPSFLLFFTFGKGFLCKMS